MGGVWRRFHPRLGTEPPTATYTLKELVEDVTPADVQAFCVPPLLPVVARAKGFPVTKITQQIAGYGDVAA